MINSSDIKSAISSLKSLGYELSLLFPIGLFGRNGRPIGTIHSNIHKLISFWWYFRRITVYWEYASFEQNLNLIRRSPIRKDWKKLVGRGSEFSFLGFFLHLVWYQEEIG